jgi:hypothetical protein
MYNLRFKSGGEVTKKEAIKSSIILSSVKNMNFMQRRQAAKNDYCK